MDTNEVMLTNNESEQASGLPPAAAVLQLASGYMLAQALYVAAKLRIADVLSGGPRSASELAAAVGADPSALYRLMRMLARHGVFGENASGRFEQSAISECLRTNGAGSLRALVILWNEEQYRAWGDLLETVKTGESAFNRLFGSGWVDYYAHGDKEAAEVFNSAMTALTAQTASAVAEAYDFSSVNKVVDVGGGHGVLLTSILKAFPRPHGIVYDLDTVISGASRQIEAAGLAPRCDAVSGDFFVSVPSGGDVYILSQVLHAWDDEHCLAILRNCHRAMVGHGKLLVVEMVIGSGRQSSLATLSDVHMMVVTGGRERTKTEYKDLLNKAGFELSRIIPTKATVQVIEAVRV